MVPAGYELVRKLGRGGMGEVYLARDVPADRLVAMKFLIATNNPIAVERFLVEVRALAKIDHPHIVRVLGHDFYRASPFFTMEYAPGGTLADRVARDGPLAASEAARFIAAAARALHAAHEAGVLHRDLKPSNVLLAADGTVRVSDFGLAKRTDSDDELTTGSGPLGTLAYMPPEQARRGEIDRRADVYGLGATLYHLLTGRHPFQGSEPDILAAVLRTPPQRLRSLRSDIPLGLEAIVMKCLEKNPADRYQSAAALADALERFLAGGDDLDAPQLTRWRRLRRWAVWHRSRLAVATAAVLLGVGLVIVGQFWAPLPLAPPPDPGEEIRKELAAGETVTLVGAVGPPRYHRFWLEPNTLGNPPPENKPCMFRALKSSMLELAPAPGIDRYQVDLELLHFHDRLAPGPNEFQNDSLAFYFGHASGAASNGATVHAMIVVSYKDYRGATNPKSPNPPGSRQVFFGSMGYSEEADRTPATPIVKDAAMLFQPPAGRPGIWRPIVAKITPEEVTVQWRNDKGEMVTLARRTGPEMVELHREAKRLLDRNHPGTTDLLPDWKPDLPFGVIADRASVEVRNVKVTPLK